MYHVSHHVCVASPRSQCSRLGVGPENSRPCESLLCTCNNRATTTPNPQITKPPNPQNTGGICQCSAVTPGNHLPPWHGHGRGMRDRTPAEVRGWAASADTHPTKTRRHLLHLSARGQGTDGGPYISRASLGLSAVYVGHAKSRCCHRRVCSCARCLWPWWPWCSGGGGEG